MSISNELQTLAQVSSEIDESEVKLTFANQCIKAQETLANKLKEEIQRRKEICNFKKNENHKLEADIKNAELELGHLRITHQTLQLANTEIKKELLLTKEKKIETQERIKKGEKKYEDLWIQCKKRYENIPLVKKLMQDKNKCEELKNDINILENEAQNIEKAIKDKKNFLVDKDQKQIIQLAKFFIQEVPTAMKIIKEKSAMINKLTKEIEDIAKEQEAIRRKASEAASIKPALLPEEENVTSENNWAIDDSPMMPKLHLPSVDMDVINFKLDINKVTLHTSPIKRTVSFTELEKNTIKKSKPDENLKDNYISCYLTNTATEDNEDKQGHSPTNYSKKKLINIIEDIKIDDSETYKLMAQANIDKFQSIDVIASKKAKEYIKSPQALEIEEIQEDVEIPNTNEADLIVPPSQFLDLTQEKNIEGMQQEVEPIANIDGGETSPKFVSNTQSKSSQESNKKKVSFDLTTPQEPMETTIASLTVENIEDETPNESATSPLNLSEVTDDNYMAIKDMILKKKNQLDLSPQFVYAKNTLQKRNEDEIIKSKFFETSANEITGNNDVNTGNENNNFRAEHKIDQIKNAQDITTEKVTTEGNLDGMDVDNAVSSPKQSNTEKPVTGLLFTHGPQGIPDCLDISLSTTGYEEGDPDFPTCLDSSLLLSPKADLPMQMSGNNSEAGSQDLPNFLSGFRKGGLSFFKQQPTDSNPESNKQNSENNFNFNFGSDEKKARGGLFSFFR